MKSIQLIALFLFAFTITTTVNAANENNQVKKTAESVYAFAHQMETIDTDLLQHEIKALSITEKVKLAKMAMADAKQMDLAATEGPSVILYILAVLLPPLAVGLHTNWGMPTVFNIIFTLLGWLPGVVHAFIVLGR